MRIRFFSYRLLGGILLICVLIWRCNLDQGLEFGNPSETISHGIKGSIVFSGAWSQDITEVRLVVSTTFPPDPAQPLDVFIFSDPIQVGVRSVDYGISLSPATYQIIAVIFRERNQPWDLSNIMAVHSPLSACTIIPDLSQAVVVESETSVIDSVDLDVDLSKGSISGEIAFVGAWPADINFAGIVAFENPIDFSNLAPPCGLAILPLDVENAQYKIRVPPNDYLLLVIAGSSLADLVETLINNEGGGDITQILSLIRGIHLAPIAVQSQQDTPNINITVDWNTALK
ncbi:MAG: hypothetical protein ACE5IR_07330 [bacterium]